MNKKLNKYNHKRDFNITKEPKGKLKESQNKLAFVMQLHFATRNHFDLRLEHDGVLLSWAVPKGPSYNPSDKRLAIMVEDHPLDYRHFEGVIPKGEYGAGPVMIWDEGYYTPLTNLKNGLVKGSLKFALFGKRLKGKWALVHLKDNEWLLIKDSDEYSKDHEGMSKFIKSIKTNRTIGEINNEG